MLALFKIFYHANKYSIKMSNHSGKIDKVTSVISRVIMTFYKNNRFVWQIFLVTKPISTPTIFRYIFSFNSKCWKEISKVYKLKLWIKGRRSIHKKQRIFMNDDWKCYFKTIEINYDCMSSAVKVNSLSIMVMKPKGWLQQRAYYANS